ncbi:MAG: AAA family ATPase [Phycisphaerales bacterium]
MTGASFCIHVVGTSGSGKTTYAKRVADQLGVPHIELDSIYWGPNWTPTETDEFRAQVREKLEQHAWVIEGNYRAVQDVIWECAEEIVWLDLPAPIVWWRVITRTVKRRLSGQTLWNNNRETWRSALFSWDSVIIWSIRTHHGRKRAYSKLLTNPPRDGIQVTRLSGRRAVKQDVTARTLDGHGSQDGA